MNIMHSSAQNSWMTPLPIIEKVRMVLGGIDLDPASSAQAQDRVLAKEYFDESDDGLLSVWFGSVFCNPPGGKLGNKSLPFLFWRKLQQEVRVGNIKHAVFLFFSIEGLAVSQGKDVPPATRFPICIPQRRIEFDHPDAEVKKTQPSHSNAIVYVPGVVDHTRRFVETFSDIGDILVPYRKRS